MLPATGLWHSVAILSLALLSSCTPLQETDSIVMVQAQIVSSLRGRPVLGQSFSISCEGNSTFPESIMYWLANDSFVNTLYPSGAVREAETIETTTSTGLFLNRTLSFNPFTQRDLHTKFKCIILDPASVTQKKITWVLRRPQKRWKQKGVESSKTPELSFRDKQRATPECQRSQRSPVPAYPKSRMAERMSHC